MSRPCSMHSVLVIAAAGDLSTRRDGRAAARGNLAAGKLLTHNGNNSSSAASARCAAVFLLFMPAGHPHTLCEKRRSLCACHFDYNRLLAKPIMEQRSGLQLRQQDRLANQN